MTHIEAGLKSHIYGLSAKKLDPFCYTVCEQICIPFSRLSCSSVLQEESMEMCPEETPVPD
jgi:hypothetical protein